MIFVAKIYSMVVGYKGKYLSYFESLLFLLDYLKYIVEKARVVYYLLLFLSFSLDKCEYENVVIIFLRK